MLVMLVLRAGSLPTKRVSYEVLAHGVLPPPVMPVIEEAKPT